MLATKLNKAAQLTHSLPSLTADPEIPRASDRKIVEVAVGILQSPNEHYLMTTRPQGKVYAGYWEFPGGKLETGETVQAALKRELIEEIGVVITQSTICCEQIVDYPHALVRLSFCIATEWVGDLAMREGQAFAWTDIPVSVSPVLPGAKAILAWLAKRNAALE
jgi:8-oxo-dGTP diphosphatase